MPGTGDQRRPVLTGGCQCGAVRYALYSLPRGTTICHCRMCQKACGGPFEALAPVVRADFAWTRGPAGTFRSSSIVERDFCSSCGTPLTYRNLGRDRVSVTVGSLDEPARAGPVGQYGLESRLPWSTPALLELPGVETDASYAGLTSYQHPDHDTQSWSPQHGETSPS